MNEHSNEIILHAQVCRRATINFVPSVYVDEDVQYDTVR
jgi:hypothetical protein